MAPLDDARRLRRRPRLAAIVVGVLAALLVPVVGAVAAAPAPTSTVALGRAPVPVEPLTAPDADPQSAPLTTAGAATTEDAVAAEPVSPRPPAVESTPASAAAPSTTAAAVTATTRPAPVRTSVDFGGGLLAEVIAPAGAGPHPTLVYVHGGGWISGDHLELPVPFGLDRVHERGWAVASIGYRLAGRERDVDAADQVAEVAHVIGWLRSDGHRLDLGGELIGLGHSAGGHLLTLAAATMDPALAPDVIVAVAGVYDFGDDIRQSPLLAEVLPEALGCEPEECPAGWVDSLTPATHADAADPRTILIHGDADPVVPFRTAVDHAAALGQLGLAVDLVVVEGGDHLDRLGPAVRTALDGLLAA